MWRIELRYLAALAVGLCWCGGANADPPAEVERPDSQKLAARLQETTVTLRISEPDLGAEKAADQAEAGSGHEHRERITVVTGVSLGEGRVITFASLKAGARCRATLPDGEQAVAELRVVDEHSGLALLELVEARLPALDLAAETPPLGAAIMTAAAAGVEQPTISLGVMAGAERSLAETGLPPLLQCDLRTTESSSGAAVVDEHGRLIGLIAIHAARQDAAGWTYAVPVAHVQRLLRARGEADDEVVVLKQQRPTVGLTLGPGNKEGAVRVEHVSPGGPAEEAGIQQGDLVVRADGRRIRSAYQAVSQILKKQPGDEVEFLIEREGRQQTVSVTLAESGKLAGGAVQVGPQLTIRATGRGQIEVQNGARVAELAGQPQPDKPGAAGDRLPRDEITLLRAQIDAFARVIERMQAELARRDEAQRDTNELIKSLTDELARLRKQLGERGDKE